MKHNIRKLVVVPAALLMTAALSVGAFAADASAGYCTQDHDHSIHSSCTLDHDHAADAICTLEHDHAVDAACTLNHDHAVDASCSAVITSGKLENISFAICCSSFLHEKTAATKM